MKLLITIKDKDIFPDSTDDRDIEYKKREAARAIVFDSEGLIALMDVSKHGYHKLPGGGFYVGENVEQALERELLEEIGCRAEVFEEVGEIIEYRNAYSQIQHSYCFIANLVGEKGDSAFEVDEMENGFKVMWVDINNAIDLLSSDKTDDYQGKFILKRDLVFLETAKKICTKDD